MPSCSLQTPRSGGIKRYCENREIKSHNTHIYSAVKGLVELLLVGSLDVAQVVICTADNDSDQGAVVGACAVHGFVQTFGVEQNSVLNTFN